MTVFISELCDMTLSGLSVLNSLNILMKGMLTLEKHESIILVTTMKKSNCDHVSRKYVPLSIMNPSASDFISDSSANAAVKKKSQLLLIITKVFVAGRFLV